MLRGHAGSYTPVLSHREKTAPSDVEEQAPAALSSPTCRGGLYIKEPHLMSLLPMLGADASWPKYMIQNRMLIKRIANHYATLARFYSKYQFSNHHSNKCQS